LSAFYLTPVFIQGRFAVHERPFAGNAHLHSLTLGAAQYNQFDLKAGAEPVENLRAKRTNAAVTLFNSCPIITFMQ